MSIAIPQVIQQGTQFGPMQPFTGKSNVQVQALLDPSDLQALGKTCVMTIQHTFDGGGKWIDGARGIWKSGIPDPRGGWQPPSISCDYSAQAVPPTHVRVKLDIGGILNIGVTQTMG